MIRYLNRFWEAVDGNFKLKNIFASSWLADPGFGNGMAYMIPNEQLVEHIATNSSKIDEVSSPCIYCNDTFFLMIIPNRFPHVWISMQ